MRYLLFIFVMLLGSLAFGQKTPPLKVFIMESVLKRINNDPNLLTKRILHIIIQ